MPKPRLNLRLSGDVYAKLDEMTRRPGATKSAIIEQALRGKRCLTITPALA